MITNDLYTIIFYENQWQVFADDGDKPVASTATEREAIAWCKREAAAAHQEAKILLYNGSVCGP